MNHESTTGKSRHARSQKPAEFLSEVRWQTCYGTLRAGLRVICILAALGNILWLVLAIREHAGLPLIRSLVGPGEARALDASDVLAVGAAVAVAVLVLLMLVAWCQAPSLVIDIADILIERNRRREFQAPPHE